MGGSSSKETIAERIQRQTDEIRWTRKPWDFNALLEKHKKENESPPLTDEEKKNLDWFILFYNLEVKKKREWLKKKFGSLYVSNEEIPQLKL